MPVIDLEPATRRLAELLDGVDDAQLAAPTPCPGYTVGDLIDHVGGLAIAFAAAGAKATGEVTSQAPSPAAAHLAADWRTRIPGDLATLARTWREPAAWTGMTQVGGVDLPGEVAGLVGLDEVVIHGWDLARASGQGYDLDEESLAAVHEFLRQSADPEPEEGRGIFGPAIWLPDAAPLLDRAVGLSGRDPAWSPAAAPRSGSVQTPAG